MAGTQAALELEPDLAMFVLPRATVDAYVDIAKTSKNEKRLMWISTPTPHSIYEGVAMEANINFIKLRTTHGDEVVIGLVPGVNVGLTNTKLAKT